MIHFYFLILFYDSIFINNVILSIRIIILYYLFLKDGNYNNIINTL